MPRKKKTQEDKNSSERLVHSIIKAIHDKKGLEVVSIDLREIDARVCDFFVICHGDSTTQVSALGGNVEKEVKKHTGEKPWHVEGFQNAEWILLDYVNVVVHIFLNEMRTFYGLEKLWSDGKVVKHEPEIPTKSTEKTVESKKNPIKSKSKTTKAEKL